MERLPTERLVYSEIWWAQMEHVKNIFPNYRIILYFLKLPARNRRSNKLSLRGKMKKNKKTLNPWQTNMKLIY